MTPAIQRVRATRDPGFVAVLGPPRLLSFTRGARPELDLPAHARAASAIRRVAGRLVIVQDDVNALVFDESETGTWAVPLPAGPGGVRTFDDQRGNKHAKLDLEACAALPDGRLVAFGSGSSRARERLIVFRPEGEHRVVDGTELYAHLRALTEFAGSELNLEGAVVVGDALKIFQRGNGAPREHLLPVDATGDFDLRAFARWIDGRGPHPVLERIVQYELGEVDGVRITFTDAACAGETGVTFLACAEASPDAVRDGAVMGSVVGFIEGDRARTVPILDADGHACRSKLEGIEPVPGAPDEFEVVADMDRPDEPATLYRLRLQLV